MHWDFDTPSTYCVLVDSCSNRPSGSVNGGDSGGPARPRSGKDTQIPDVPPKHQVHIITRVGRTRSYK